MKKAMKFIVLFAVLLVSVSAYTGKKVYGIEKGLKAPLFTVENDNSQMSLSDYRGKYVLLTFWSSSDAESRIACKDYDMMAQQYGEEQFCHLSVNFDRSERLFREIVRRDNLSAETQYHVSGEEASDLIEAYRMDAGYQSYLIDPDGQIIALNPGKSLLDEVMRD